MDADRLRRISDLTVKHNAEIKLIKANQRVMRSHLKRLVRSNVETEHILVSIRTTVKNIAWAIGTILVGSQVLIQMFGYLKSVK